MSRQVERVFIGFAQQALIPTVPVVSMLMELLAPTALSVGANVGIRPALIVNLQSSNLGVGDTFEFGGYTFKIISNDLALCDVIIDVCPFNQNIEDGNNYETSYVKKRVDQWFQDTKDIASKRRPDSKLWDEMDFGF